MASLPNLPSVQPDTIIDFANSESIPPQLPFKRASAGYYFDATGNFKVAGVNEPRISYNRATGKCEGLMVEYASTNSYPFSKQMNNFSLNISTTITTNAPSTLLSGHQSLFVTAPSFGTGVYCIPPISTSAYTVVSYFIKSKSGDGLLWTGNHDIGIDLKNGDITRFTPVEQSPTPFVYTEDYGGGWWRVILVSIGGGRSAVFYSRNSPLEFELCGLQYEYNDRPLYSSYIPTDGAAVSRAADLLTFDPEAKTVVGDFIMRHQGVDGGSYIWNAYTTKHTRMARTYVEVGTNTVTSAWFINDSWNGWTSTVKAARKPDKRYTVAIGISETTQYTACNGLVATAALEQADLNQGNINKLNMTPFNASLYCTKLALYPSALTLPEYQRLTQ